MINTQVKCENCAMIHCSSLYSKLVGWCMLMIKYKLDWRRRRLKNYNEPKQNMKRIWSAWHWNFGNRNTKHETSIMPILSKLGNRASRLFQESFRRPRRGGGRRGGGGVWRMWRAAKWITKSLRDARRPSLLDEPSTFPI